MALLTIFIKEPTYFLSLKQKVQNTPLGVMQQLLLTIPSRAVPLCVSGYAEPQATEERLSSRYADPRKP